MSVATAPPSTPTHALRAGMAIVERLTVTGATSVHVDHHAYAGRHSVRVSIHPCTVAERRAVMGSTAFVGAAWEFTRHGVDHHSSTAFVGGIEVDVHGRDGR